VSAPDRIPAPVVAEYATYIPVRDPKIKTHKTIAHAKNALNNTQNIYGRNDGYRCDATLYQLSGDWYLPVLEVKAGTSREDYPELAKKPPSKRHRQQELNWAKRVAESRAREAQEAQVRYEQMLKEIFDADDSG